MKLFTTPKAISPARVHFFLAEKGIEVERELINLMEGEHRSAAYRSRVPNGRVPALQLDDGTVLCETVAISRYVEEAIQPDPPLLGTNPLERARIEMYDRMMELELMLPMAMTFRHTHPAMKALEDQVAEYGEKQRGVAERFPVDLDLGRNDLVPEFLAQIGGSTRCLDAVGVDVHACSEGCQGVGAGTAPILETGEEPELLVGRFQWCPEGQSASSGFLAVDL